VLRGVVAKDSNPLTLVDTQLNIPLEVPEKASVGWFIMVIKYLK
jgi:hypothetical protein